MKYTIRNLYQHINKQGPPILLFCLGEIPECEHLFSVSLILEDESQDETRVVLCPSFFTLSRHPNTCDQASAAQANLRGYFQVSELQRAMLAAPHISGEAVRLLKSYVEEPAGCHLLVTSDHPNIRASGVKNIQSHKLLALWAWIKEQQQTHCPQQAPLWGILTNPSVADDRTELRKLLYATDPAHENEVSGATSCSGLGQCSLMQRILDAAATNNTAATADTRSPTGAAELDSGLEDCGITC